MKIHWVKKTITDGEWRNTYNQKLGYSFIRKIGNEIDIGFLVVGEIPSGCTEITSPEELRILNLQRESRNERPFPLEKEDNQTTLKEEEDKKKVESKIEKMREFLKDKQIIK